MQNTYKEKVVLVTGASRGIGKAIVDRFASQGAYVIATATTKDSVKKISDNFSKNNFKGLGLITQVLQRTTYL